MNSQNIFRWNLGKSFYIVTLNASCEQVLIRRVNSLFVERSIRSKYNQEQQPE